MSVIMLRPERLFQIANFLYELETFGFDRFGFNCPLELTEYVFRQTNNVSRQGTGYKTLDFYKDLVDANEAAYSSVYNPSIDTEAEYFAIDLNVFRPMIKLRVADVTGEYPQAWHYKMSNLIGTYLYQIADLPQSVNQKDLEKVLKAVRNILNDYIVSNARIEEDQD